MPVKTQADLCNRILIDLNVIAQGDVASSEDMAAMIDTTTTLAAELQVRSILYLPDLLEIPDHVFEPLVDYFVARKGPSYGRAAVDQATLELLEARVEETTRPPATRRLLATDAVLRVGGKRRGFLTSTAFTNGTF